MGWAGGLLIMLATLCTLGIGRQPAQAGPAMVRRSVPSVRAR